MQYEAYRIGLQYGEAFASSEPSNEILMSVRLTSLILRRDLETANGRTRGALNPNSNIVLNLILPYCPCSPSGSYRYWGSCPCVCSFRGDNGGIAGRYRYRMNSPTSTIRQNSRLIPHASSPASRLRLDFKQTTTAEYLPW